jgi:hypothetical protein
MASSAVLVEAHVVDDDDDDAGALLRAARLARCTHARRRQSGCGGASREELPTSDGLHRGNII